MASNTLLIDEQFSLGGADFGSAYDPSELLGDSGVAGRAELRYSRDGDFQWVPSYQFYTFYDIGTVWNRDAGAGTSDEASLADAGVGLRFNAQIPLSGTFEFAYPLTRPVAADVGAGGDGSGFHPRAFFSLAYRF
jgi:hemolysin activation/secretion protein